MAALPALIDERDAVFVDHQAHASIQNVTDAQGTRTSVNLLSTTQSSTSQRLEKMAGSYRKIWHLPTASTAVAMFRWLS